MFPMTITINNVEQLTTVVQLLGMRAEFAKEAEKATAQVAAVVKEAKPKKAQAEVAQNTASSTSSTTSMQQAAEAVATKTTPDAAPSSESGVEGVTQMSGSDAIKALDNIAAQDGNPVKYEDAAAAVTSLAKAKGRDAAIAVLGKFGAAKLPDVEPEHFAAVVAACAEA